MLSRVDDLPPSKIDFILPRDRVKEAESKFNELLKAIYFNNRSIIDKVKRANDLSHPIEPEDVGLKNQYFLYLKQI